jgi:hypothetical protein
MHAALPLPYCPYPHAAILPCGDTEQGQHKMQRRKRQYLDETWVKARGLQRRVVEVGVLGQTL